MTRTGAHCLTTSTQIRRKWRLFAIRYVCPAAYDSNESRQLLGFSVVDDQIPVSNLPHGVRLPKRGPPFSCSPVRSQRRTERGKEKRQK